MILISNLGNLTGPDRANENTIRAIDNALATGFDCKIEVIERNGRLFLPGTFGREPHDKIQMSWLYTNRDRLWIQCANFKAFRFFSENLKDHGFNYFCLSYQGDPTFTSKGNIWLVGSSPWSFGILDSPDAFKLKLEDLGDAQGVCSDFIAAYVKKSL